MVYLGIAGSEQQLAYIKEVDLTRMDLICGIKERGLVEKFFTLITPGIYHHTLWKVVAAKHFGR